MWLESHPLFRLSVVTSSSSASANSNNNNDSSSKNTTSKPTAFQIEYKIDEEHSVSSVAVFDMRTSALRLLRHPNVLKITAETQYSSAAGSENNSTMTINNTNIRPKIKSTSPTFVSSLKDEWKYMHSSEILHGVYEITNLLAFILQKTGLRFTSFSSIQLFRDLPDCDLKGLSERAVPSDAKDEDEDDVQISCPPQLFFGSPATPVSPLRYRWVLGDGKSFFDRSEFVRSPLKKKNNQTTGGQKTFDDDDHQKEDNKEEEEDSSVEQDKMLMQSSVSAIARWLKQDIVGALKKNKIKLSEQDHHHQDSRIAEFMQKIEEWATKVDDLYANSGETEESKKEEEEQQKPENNTIEQEEQKDDENAEGANEKQEQEDTSTVSLQSQFEAIVAADKTSVKDLDEAEQTRFKQRLFNFYSKHSPDNIKSVELAVKMSVSESQVFEKVCAKYNVDRLEEFGDATEQNVAPSVKKRQEEKQEKQQTKKRQTTTDWSITALTDLILFLHDWSITQRNDALSVVLHIGNNLHAAEPRNLEALFDILAESITLVPCHVAAKRIWPWLIRPGYLSQNFAVKSFVRLVNFARLTLHHHHQSGSSSLSSSSNSLQKKQQHQQELSCSALRDVLGPLIASTISLSLVTSARDVFSVQRSNSVEVIMACLRRKVVEGVSEERKVASLPGMTIPLLVRIVVPELLFSLVQILMMISSSSSSSSHHHHGGSAADQQQQQQQQFHQKLFQEFLGTPLQTVSFLCQTTLSDNKQLLQTAQQIQKALAEKVANSFGGRETCYSTSTSSSTTSTNSSTNHKKSKPNVVITEEEKWNCAMKHLDCLDCVLVNLFELMLHSSLQNNEAAASTLRSKLFETLVAPVLGFVFMNSCNIAKREEDAVLAMLKKKRQEKNKLERKQQQQEEQNNSEHEATTTPKKEEQENEKARDAKNSDKPSSTKEEQDQENSSDTTSVVESPVQIPDFAAERKKDRRVLKTKKKFSRRNRYSDEENSEDDEEEEFFEEEEEVEESSFDEEEHSNEENDDEEEKQDAQPDTSSTENVNDDHQQQQQEEEDAVENTEQDQQTNQNQNQHHPSLTFLSHLSRILAKLLFIWHQPGAIHSTGSRSLLWQVILRGGNVVTSSSGNTNTIVKIAPRIASAIFDPFVEAAMSVKEAIEFEISSSSADGKKQEEEETENSSSSKLLSSAQRSAATIYFEITQYLLPALLHLSMRGFSSVSIQLLMKMLGLNEFLENLRTSMRLERDRRVSDGNKNDENDDNDDDDENEKNISSEEKQARNAMSSFVMPWCIQLEEATNNLFKIHHHYDDDHGQDETRNTDSNKAKMIAQIWSSLPNLRQVCARDKLVFFSSTNGSGSGGSLLTEIATSTLDASNSPKNQVNWILNSFTDCILSPPSLSSTSSAANAQQHHDAYPTVLALLNGGSFVSCPPGIPNAVDSDTMLRSWYRNFVSAGSGVGTNCERAVLVHLMSRFGGKEFDPFPLLPPLQ